MEGRNYEDVGAEKPLFGEATRKDRVLNLVVGSFTALLVTITLISAFAFPHWPPRGINVFFAFCIVLILLSHLILIYWYRQGDLEPRFRTLIYYNAFTIILLCICANIYIHSVK
ncbi:transmembrane protein 243 [Lamellibrachia satsuma]|nr:transmembrane protein 243 [Lamellibrachia satsuma]